MAVSLWILFVCYISIIPTIVDALVLQKQCPRACRRSILLLFTFLQHEDQDVDIKLIRNKQFLFI